MRRGTTPTVTLKVDADLEGCEVHAAMRNNGRTSIYEGDRLEISSDGQSSSVALRLTQEDTLALDAGYPARFQLRWTCGGEAYATGIAQTDVEAILEEGEI